MYYWVIIIIMLTVLIVDSPQRERFQEMFGFSGHREPIDETAFTFGSELNGYTDVTDQEGVSADEVNMCVKASLKFINEKLKMCSYPVETSKIHKMKRDQDVVYTCKFMFMVKSTNYPFMLGVETDVHANGKVLRAATQDTYKGVVPEEREENFLSFSEVEDFKVYSR